MQLTELMDPLAGNSIVTYLHDSIHSDALNQIGNFVSASARNHTRMRRKKELLGEDSIAKAKQASFHPEGLLEG